MIKKEGHYILTIEDWNLISKYFMVNPKAITIKEFPNLMFTEYKVYDIFSNKVLFSFYNHDGKIRISGNGKTIMYEIDISQVLTKNPTPIPQSIFDAIKINAHNSHAMTMKNIKNKFVNKNK